MFDWIAQNWWVLIVIAVIYLFVCFWWLGIFRMGKEWEEFHFHGD